jgi:hypothetical protein
MSSSDRGLGGQGGDEERGTLHRRPEDQLPGATNGRLRPARGPWRGSTSGPVDPRGWAPPTACTRHETGVATPIDRAVARAFRKARGLHGSPRLHADLLEDGWKDSEKTVADSVLGQGLVARRSKRRNGLTRQHKTAPKFPDCCVATSPRTVRTPVGGRNDRDPHSCGEVVPGFRDRPLLPASAGCRHVPAPGRRAGVRAIEMAVAARGGRDAIWREEEASHLSHRPLLDLHRERVHDAVPPARHPAVDDRVGSCFDNVPRRRSSPPWSGGPLTPTSSTTPAGPSRRTGLVLRVSQPRPPAQHDRDDEPDQLREHRGPRPGIRVEKPSTNPGEPQTTSRSGSGSKAAQAGHRVLFATATEWVARLQAAHSAGRLTEELARLRRYGLLIVDKVGYILFEQDAANLFFQLVSSRYEHASLILTSNLPSARWGDGFGDQVVAAAMIRPHRPPRRGHHPQRQQPPTQEPESTPCPPPGQRTRHTKLLTFRPSKVLRFRASPTFPYVFLDATYCKARLGGARNGKGSRVVSQGISGGGCGDDGHHVRPA